jgi:hypothetical protein
MRTGQRHLAHRVSWITDSVSRVTARPADLARRASRWLSPTGFVLVALFFVLPFVSVSCDAPGGFGRAAPGGTTTYTGVTLVTGGAPDVSPADRVRSSPTSDRLGVQPLAVALLVLAVGGAVAAGVARPALYRRLITATVAAIGLVFLVATRVTVRTQLESRLREQLTVPLPAGKQAGDYVHDQFGFVAGLVVLLSLVAANLFGAVRLARRR